MNIYTEKEAAIFTVFGVILLIIGFIVILGGLVFMDIPGHPWCWWLSDPLRRSTQEGTQSQKKETSGSKPRIAPLRSKKQRAPYDMVFWSFNSNGCK